MPPDAPGTLVAPQPVPPERQYSFTDQQVNNPSGQPPGDKLDGEYDRTNQTISDTIAWAATSLNTDGSLKPHVVGESQLVPGLLDDIGIEAVALLQPMVEQTGNYATEALNAVLASNAGATLSGRHATQAGNFADEARKIADTLQAAAKGAEDDARSTSSDADRAENAANHADGSEAVAQAYADVGMAWAEHMPDTIPPNILAVQAVTGDHWSARWWANRAAVYAGGGTPGGAAVGTTPDSGVYEPLWWDTNSGQLYVQYNDGSSTQWVAASSIDASTLEGSFLPITGGTVTGNVTIGAGTGGPLLVLDGAAGAAKGVHWSTASTKRWRLETTTADHLALNAYDASGTWFGTAIEFANDAASIVTNFPLLPNATAAIAQGGVVGINATARNTGTNAGQGAKFSYFSTGSANGFHIGKSSLSIHDPTSFVGSAPVYQSDWMVCVSPNDTVHNWGATTMEMNVTNRGNDMGWKRDRGSANPTGVLLLVPETATFAGTGGGEGKNATFGLSVCHSGELNSTGFFAKFYNGLLIEPDTIAGLTGRGIYMTGDITATPSQYPYGPMQFEGTWLHGIDHTKATYDDGRATTMAMGQRITWIAGATGAETTAASILATGSGADASLALNAGGSGGVTVNSLSPLTVNIVAQSTGYANALLLQESGLVAGGATVFRIGKDFSTLYNSGYMYFQLAATAVQSTLRLGMYGTPIDHILMRGDGAVLMGGNVGFNNTGPIAKPNVTGAKGGNAALASLLTALAAYGLVTDSST